MEGKKIRIAAAQMACVPGDLEANLATHLRFAEAARRTGADVLVFPELSLMGYELDRMASCRLTGDEPLLAPLRGAARQAGMTIVAGASVPGAGPGLPAIGAFILAPGGGVSIYRKQHLHPGEEGFATAGPSGARIQACAALPCALAICADTAHAAHAEAAATEGALLYLAGVLVSKNGHATDSSRMQDHARRHGMGVLMANHGAPSGAYDAAGCSAFWSAGGELVVAAPGPGSRMVVADHDGRRWRGEVIDM